MTLYQCGTLVSLTGLFPQMFWSWRVSQWHVRHSCGRPCFLHSTKPQGEVTLALMHHGVAAGEQKTLSSYTIYTYSDFNYTEQAWEWWVAMKKAWKYLAGGGTLRKIMKQIDPFGAFWCILFNYADPVYGVATICHQVRCLRWGQPSLFHTAMSLLI